MATEWEVTKVAYKNPNAHCISTSISLTSILKMAKTYKLGHCGDHELILKKNEQGLHCIYFCDNKNSERCVEFTANR